MRVWRLPHSISNRNKLIAPTHFTLHIYHPGTLLSLKIAKTDVKSSIAIKYSLPWRNNSNLYWALLTTILILTLSVN